jgi:hypothetical protein
MSRNSLGRVSKKRDLVTVRVGGVKVFSWVAMFDMFERSVLVGGLVRVCAVRGCNSSWEVKSLLPVVSRALLPSLWRSAK